MSQQRWAVFWGRGISFYLDGKGFEFKTNPFDQARTPKRREWRKRTEGLDISCVVKGKKEGCRNANFMVVTAHRRGVVMCRQYESPITGAKFADIVREEFRRKFPASHNSKNKLFLMDGCPIQNAAAARREWEKMGATLFKISPRSPELNPIENFFNMVSTRLTQEAIEKEIKKGSFDEFWHRVTKFMLEFDRKQIDAIIDTMDKRLEMIIARKDQRIKH